MTNHRSSNLDQIRDDIEALTRPFNHSEQLDTGSRHNSRHESLIDQLDEQLRSGSKTSSDIVEFQGRSAGESKPPVDEELLALMLKAATVGNRIVHTLGGQLRQHPKLNLAQIPSLAVNADDDTVADVADQINRLRIEIEVKLSWRFKNRRLSASCPLCDKKGGLIVSMDGHGPTGAKCVKCEATWDRGVLGLLAGGLNG